MKAVTSNYIACLFNCQFSFGDGVYPTIAVGIGGRGFHASGGWDCLADIWERRREGASPAHSVAWALAALGRRVGPLVAQGYIRFSTRRVERCQGGVAGGVPPHKGGQELQGAVRAGRTRERLATRTHGRVGTRRVGDRLELRTHGGGGLGRRLLRVAMTPHPAAGGGVSGGRCGGSPPAQGRAEGPTVQKDPNRKDSPLCPRMDRGLVMAAQVRAGTVQLQARTRSTCCVTPPDSFGRARPKPDHREGRHRTSSGGPGLCSPAEGPFAPRLGSWSRRKSPK